MGKNTAVVLMLVLLIAGVAVLGWVLTRPLDPNDGNGGTPNEEGDRVRDPGALKAGKPGAVTGEVRILATQAPADGIEVEVTGAGKPIYVETNSLGKFIAHAPSEVELTVRVVAPEPYATLLLKGIVLDETDAVLKGNWQYSTHTPPYVGIGYLHDQKSGKGEKSVTWTPEIPEAGRYEVRISHCHDVRSPSADQPPR